MARTTETRLNEMKSKIARTEAFIERLKTQLERWGDKAQQLQNKLLAQKIKQQEAEVKP